MLQTSLRASGQLSLAVVRCRDKMNAHLYALSFLFSQEDVLDVCFGIRIIIFLVASDGVRLSPLRMSVTIWPILPASDNG
jgi:hypothetical protein